MSGKGKIIRKITGWFFATLFLLLLMGTLLVWLRMPGYIKENLSEFVSGKSDGLYTLTIEGVERKIFPFAFKFTGVSLTPDEKISLKAQKKTPGKTIYSFQAREVKVEGVNFISLFKNKIFIIRNIEITNPVIKLSGEDVLRNDSARMADKVISEIRPLFKDYLHEIRIHQIKFSNAHFGLYAAAGDSALISKADQVSLEIQGFRTDSAMLFRKTRFFETDDVLVKIKNYRNEMGDSLHVATIDTLEYSLKTTDIRAVGFHLAPLFRDKKKNLYDVEVPEVYVKSKSITHFALDDSLKISYLEFHNPNIQFFQKENPNPLNLQDINNFDLYTLVQNQFSKIEVDSFYFAGAKLEIYRQPETDHYQQQFTSIDIILYGFALDSTSAQNSEKLLHSDELEMRVADYHLRMKDNQHIFRADSLFVSTFSDQLGAKNIHISPVSSRPYESPTEVNIECEALNIEKVNLRNLYHTRTLPTSKIEILTPSVNLQHHPARKKQEQQKEEGLLFDLVSDYLIGVYSNIVYIEDGELNIQNRQNQKLQGYFETNFTFTLTDFTLDSASVKKTDKFFFATNFDLEFTDYQMQLVDDLHKLAMGKVVISSMENEVLIENLDLHPVSRNITFNTMKDYNRSELYNISVPKIRLLGVNLNNAFFNNKLKIADFKISDPTIYFENFGALREAKTKMDFSEFYGLVFNYINDFDIHRFSVPDGKLIWVNHTRKGKTISFDNEFSASLENFRLNENVLDEERLFFSDNFDITIKDQQFELSDSVHILKAEEIGLSSSNSTVSIKNALLFPLITSEKYSALPTTYQVSIPELKISHFNFQKAYYSGNPAIKQLEIISPKFQVYNQTGKTKSLDLNKYKFPLPSFIQTMQINEFKVRDAEVITYEKTGTNHRAMANFHFSINMPGVLMKNNQQNNLHISSENIILDITGFRAPLGKSHNFSVEGIKFNKNLQTVSIDTLKVNPFLTKDNDNVFSILAPEIEFTAFNLTRALNQNKFAFNEINITNPTIAIEINKQINNDTLEFLQTLDLYPYAEPLLDQIKVNNFRLKNAELNLNWLKKELFNNNINLEFKDILIAENQLPSNLLNSKEFEISATDLKTKSNDNLYEFTTDSLIYNSARHEVLLTNVEINPLIDKDDFPKQKGFQTDVVNARFDFVKMEGIDEKKWLQENILDATVFKIGPANLHIFRNKRYPFNQKQRPPWPQDLIKDMKQPFVFDSLVLLPSKIRYSELMGISDQPGYVEFHDMTLTGGTLSNIEKILQQQKYFTVSARTQLYDKSLLQARFKFDMTSPVYAHTVKGSLLPMPLTPLNHMLEKSEPMSIEAGTLNQFEFELSLNSTRAEGLFYMGYDNLNVAVLEYKSDKRKKAGFASFWANKMVLNTQNPKDNTLEPVSISYDRDIHRSIINYWWKSIYSGAKEVLGIKPKE